MKKTDKFEVSVHGYTDNFDGLQNETYPLAQICGYDQLDTYFNITFDGDGPGITQLIKALKHTRRMLKAGEDSDNTVELAVSRPA